jgi:predicted  nucleic acid-binding Zn-ribbon protein
VEKLEPKMKALVGIQDCDTRIREIQKKREEGPLKIQRLEEGLKVIESKLKEDLAQLESYKQERRGLEQEIEDLESKINKSNIKLANIKSNKEYTAGLKEISDLKAGKSLLEDKVIDLMEEIEAHEASFVASTKEKERLEEKVKEDSHDILKELKALDKDLESLERERARFSQSIDEDLLSMYDSIRRHKGGVAISSVIQGVCQTCHMGIPPQKFNDLIRGDELMSCPHCKRIIYWGGDAGLQDFPAQDK